MTLKNRAKFEEKLICCFKNGTNLVDSDPNSEGLKKSEHSKVSKICTLIGSFCAKYITFELKKFRGVISHYTEDITIVLLP